MDKPQKNESEQINFFALCYIKFIEASQKMGEVKHYFEIAGKRVCLVFAGEKMVPVITPALEHRRIYETHQPELTIYIWDSESTSVEIPDAPCNPYCFTHRGDIKGFNSHRIKTAFKWSENSLSVMDLYTNKAIFAVKSNKALPYQLYSTPLLILFHWWLEKQDCQMFHAAAIGNDEGAVLITGNNNSAKTIATFSCFRPGMQYSRNDYLIVQLKPAPCVYSLYSSVTLDNKDPKKIPELDELQTGKQISGKGKTVLQLYPQFKEHILHKKNLKGIFITEMHPDSGIVIEAVSQINALRTISFKNITQLPCTGWHTHHFIRELLHKVPSFKLTIGTDSTQIHKIFYGFLNNPGKYSHYNLKETQSTKPLISLIIPVHNGESFIREAIENVISQNYPVLEIIVVNDGSTDNTEAIIGSINQNIRYIKQENEGPASARNRGLKEATGQFVAYLDVDDLFPDGTLNALMEEMLHQPELDVVHGYAQLLQKDPQSRKFELSGNPKESYPYYICAGLYRTSVFDKVGLFDPSLKFSEDTDWFTRANELNCKIKRIEEVTLLVRRHDSNMTKGKDLIELKVPQVLKRKLERKRRSD